MPNVLLVDDNVTFARFLRVLLESKLPGIHVRTVYTAAAARDCLASWRPDLALLDVRLPDGNGHSLREELAAAHPNLRFVMMSAEPLSAPRLRRLDNVVGVLVKPFASEDIVRLVRKALPVGPAKDRSVLTPTTMPCGTTPAPPARLKQQLIQLLTGLYDIRQTLRASGLREPEVHSVVENKLIPLITVVSDMSRETTGHGSSRR